MSTRVLSLLLAAWLLCVGFTASAQPLALAPAAGAMGTAEAAFEATGVLADGETPLEPGTLLDRDSLIDPPELFEGLRLGDAPDNDAAAPHCRLLAPPPPPFIEGLRRPPRSA